jgi:4-diphosphocytidyl-2-C-methyl-D-erythritol kinase
VAARRARLRAHAKINLSLRVLGKRPDGYHELRTVFQTIGLHDTIEVEFRKAPRTRLEIDGPQIPDNLILRAARLFLEETRTSAEIRFRLTKNIPMGGGLGGGSSDAAAVLLALPVLAGKAVELPVLMNWGARMGSDVPFFMTGGTALGLGRGEELYPLPDYPSKPLIVLAPQLHVSTPEAYRALGRELTSPGDFPKLDIFQAFVWSMGLDSSSAQNDFEAVVFSQHAELGRWRRKLERLGAQPARLSGSGAALFGVFPDRAKLQGALPPFRTEPLQVFSTRTITRGQYRAGWRRSLQEHIEGMTWPPRSRTAR